VAYRPFPALRIFREKQRAATSALLPPNMLDYSLDNQTSSAHPRPSRAPTRKMHSASLASGKRRAIGQGVAETLIIQIVDDDESMREVLASLLRSVAFVARSYPSVDAFCRCRVWMLRGA
jgi:hypothetical protein